jgi:L-alanine-DL-glutamate epimerase-like enolase superfamily enzyme
MKILRIETFSRPQVAIVKVTAEDGSCGFGQTAPSCADITAQVLHRQVAPLCLGQPIDDLAALNQRVIEETYKFPGSYICRALAGVDTALWDLRGKLAGKSVCELLGGTPRPFPVYGSSMRRDITPEDEATRLRRLRDEAGFTAFKIRIGRRTGHDIDQWPGRTEALIPAVRDALGGDVTLHADGNSGFGVARAIEVGRRLEDHGYGHFEEPCLYWELEQTAEVAAALDIPVAGGEQDCRLTDWRRMIAMPAVDIVQPDVCYLGGLTRTLEVNQMAAEAGLLCVPHSANHSLVTVFALHLMGAIPNARPEVEFSIEPQGWADGLFEPALRVVNGSVQIPSGPGWGVTISEAWMADSQCHGTEGSS